MASHVRVTGGGGYPSTRITSGGTGGPRLVEKHWDVWIYGPPNNAIAGILKSEEVGRIVGDYTVKVAETYKNLIAPRRSNDARPSKQAKGHLIDTVTAYMNPNDGYKRDRWVGVVTVGSPTLPYGAADEYGRNEYSQYPGSYDLVHALRMHLPHKP